MILARTCLVLLVAALALPACDGNDDGAADAIQTPEAAERPRPECPNELRVLDDDTLRRPGSLEGDVTGDGAPDQIFVAVDSGGDEGCQGFVIVETATGETHVVGIEQEGMFELAPERELPRLNSLAEVDERPGAEIVIDVLAGAATEFVGLFSLGGGVLERIEIDAEFLPGDSVFPYGGSVGNFHGSDCSDDGLVVMASAAPSEDRYLVDRRFMRPEEGTLVYQPDRDERHLVEFEEIGRRFPEFRLAPFGNCG